MCVYKGCKYSNIAVIASILSVKFNYCKKHKKYIESIYNRVTKHKLFKKKKYATY
jgi:hypothetical protein